MVSWYPRHLEARLRSMKLKQTRLFAEVLEDRRMLSGLPIKMGIMGDSLSDEYGEQAYGAYADNWVEQLVTSGGIDVGPIGAWGEPRRTLHEYNWARYAATSNDLLSSGQHTGLASQVIPSDIDYGVLEIGDKRHLAV